MKEEIIHNYISDDGNCKNQNKEVVERYEELQRKQKCAEDRAEKDLSKYIVTSFIFDEAIYHLVQFDVLEDTDGDTGLRTAIGLHSILSKKYPHYGIDSVNEIILDTNDKNQICYCVLDDDEYDQHIDFINPQELITKVKNFIFEANNIIKILEPKQ